METYLLAHNVRSAYNVGGLFRLGDAAGVTKLFLTGYTPYPKLANDSRPAYVAAEADKTLRKTGLIGVGTVAWEHYSDALQLCRKLQNEGVKVISVELTARSRDYLEYFSTIKDSPELKICFIVGHEKDGLDWDILELSDEIIQIPMEGRGNSLNVAMAATAVLYGLKAVIGRGRIVV